MVKYIEILSARESLSSTVKYNYPGLFVEV